MGDSQDAKGKGQYHSWSGPENRLLLRSLVDAINNGFRDASGKFNKLTFETRVLSVLRQQLGSKKTYGHYKNRMKILKTRYHNLTDFLRCNSDDDVNPFNSQIEDSEKANDISFVHMMNSGEDIIHQQGYENVVFSSLEKSTGEKLPLRKKARTDSYLDKACEEVTEISSQIFGMIQKRWEKEDEEKEAKDKANNVWDAINEIPDLDDDLRYEAMTLVHSLGMKSGFVKMSVADRRGWIKQNLRKQS
ncbi:hypothetical protein BRARA_K01545 [Brassica rapa]|uniref:Uncharacterized protein n=1 Tax=Brassica campestris TaxID=3711 RepID=A0A397L607_BRACM|nr:hypothetical protein BRARA_K01545 [Brassica rapa]